MSRLERGILYAVLGLSVANWVINMVRALRDWLTTALPLSALPEQKP